MNSQTFILRLEKGSIEDMDVSGDVSDNSIEHKICEVCGEDLDPDNFFKSDLSQDGHSIKCKKCSRKSYAANALEKIRDYVEPDTPFKKDDLLKQAPNRMQYLDYIWTLQEFNLLTQDEQSDTYTLKPEEVLNAFIEKYGDKKYEIIKTNIISPPKKGSLKKIIKICETCGQKLPISDFYKSSSTEDGFSPKCKDCSRKSHAAKALRELRECVEPGVLFVKDDLLNQCENRIQFLDYLWTLQELDLLQTDEKTGAYVLKSECELNEFMEKYGQKTQENSTSTDEITSDVATSTKKTSETDITNETFVDISADEMPITTIYSNNNSKKSVKLCTTCGQKLPLSNFYKSSSNEDGYVERCKNCDDRTNAAKIMREIQKYFELGKPFTQNELSKKIDNITKAKYYLWTLQEQDLIEYQEKTHTYVLKMEIFEDYKKFIKEEPKELSLDTKSLPLDERDSTNQFDVYDTIQLNNLESKEIIYISNNMGSSNTNIMMKAIVKNENILPTLWGIETLMLSNMKKLFINRYSTNFSETIIDLEIKNESVDEILSILEDENWNNMKKTK